MKAKTLLLLLGLAGVLGGLAYYTARPRAAGDAAAGPTGRLVLPALDQPEALNRIAEILVAAPAATARVACAKDIWVAADQFNYPVRFDAVSRFLLTLADLKVGQVVGGGATVHGDLGLVPPGPAAPTNAAGAGTRIVLRDAQGATIAELLLGKTRQVKTRRGATAPFTGADDGFPDGRYVLAGTQAVLVSESFLDLPRSGGDWIDRQLVNVDPAEIVVLTLHTRDGGALAFARPASGGELQLAGLRADEEADAAKVGGLAGILEWLSFSALADPALKPAESGLDQPDVLIAKLKDGRTYTLKAGNSPTNSADRYATFSAAFEAPPVPPAVAAGATNAPAEARQDSPAEQNNKLAAEVKAFNEKVGPWIYLVAADKANCLKLKREDIARPKPKPASTNAAPTATIAPSPPQP